jgi:hypothetical protein
MIDKQPDKNDLHKLSLPDLIETVRKFPSLIEDFPDTTKHDMSLNDLVRLYSQQEVKAFLDQSADKIEEYLTDCRRVYHDQESKSIP